MTKRFILATALCPFLFVSLSSYAMPPGGPGPGPGPDRGPHFIVHDGYHHERPGRIPPYYFGYSLPQGVALALLAGVTYAVVDGMYYYRKEGDRYIYVSTPPAGTYTVVEKAASTTSSSALEPGTIVSQLPKSAKKVEYQGQAYYVVGENWYLPVSGNSIGNYVVVTNPLR